MKKDTKKSKDLFEKEAKLILKKRRRKILKKYTRKRILIPTLAVTVFILFGIYSFINSLSYQSTDDAFIEGRFIQIAPKVSGQVISLNVDDNDYVHEGDLLLEIDPVDFKNKVDELESSLNEAKANKEAASGDIVKSNADLAKTDKNLDFAKKDYNRYIKLKENGLCTKQEYESAETAYKEAIDKQNAMMANLNVMKSKEAASS